MQTIHTVMEWDHHIKKVVATWCFRTEEEAEEFYAEMKKRGAATNPTKHDVDIYTLKPAGAQLKAG